LDYSSDEAIKILQTYSEKTFDKVMKTVGYLERRTISTVELICCKKKEMTSILVEIPSKSSISFLDVDSLRELESLSGFRSTRIQSYYRKSREKDIFTLIESGYKVINDNLFNYIEALRKTQLN
jgi:hypothetical protein